VGFATHPTEVRPLKLFLIGVFKRGRSPLS
jgi:hypothetical protein